MNIVLDLPTLIFIIGEIITLIFALTRDNDSTGGYLALGSNRGWAITIWIVLSIIAALIFGGFFWW